MAFDIQLFGGRGGGSGGSYKMIGHKLPEFGKPNSDITRYDSDGNKRDRRYFDSEGNKKEDIHFTGPPNHKYPHSHYWYRDKNGNWHRTPYSYWENGGRR